LSAGCSTRAIPGRASRSRAWSGSVATRWRRRIRGAPTSP
jgi:hypothetical protein